jgi:predicted TIM-barrel fold metal-dependent hydrolase
MSSAYLATYFDPALVRFMGSSRGRGRVWFASDHPVIPAARALDAARRLPLPEEAMAEFLGDAAARVLTRPRA